jgi:hypothetical protein
MAFIAKGTDETYLGCSAARRAWSCQSRVLFNYPHTEDRILEAIVSAEVAEALADTAQLDPCRGIRTATDELSARLARLLSEFRSESAPEVITAIRAVRSELDVSKAELKLCEEHAAIVRFAPTAKGLRETLVRLIPAFGEVDERASFSARAEAAQTLQWAGLKIRFDGLNRSADLSWGQQMLNISLVVRPDLSRAIRDQRTGRFAGQPLDQPSTIS